MKKYCLSLLGLHAKWCTVVGGRNFDRMTHITWFTNTVSESVNVLLGATIGQPGVRKIGTLDEDTKLGVPVKPSTKVRSLIIRRERIHYLEEIGFHAPDISATQNPDDSKQRSKPDGNIGDPGIGGCAETFIFMVAKK